MQCEFNRYIKEEREKILVQKDVTSIFKFHIKKGQCHIKLVHSISLFNSVVVMKTQLL
jgi:hypothetical protein